MGRTRAPRSAQAIATVLDDLGADGRLTAHFAVHDRDVPTKHGVRAELRFERALAAHRPREDQDPTRVLVEPLHHADYGIARLGGAPQIRAHAIDQRAAIAVLVRT